MKVVQIQFAPWDKVYYFDPNNHNLQEGDKVIVKTDLGTEIGEVVGFAEIDKEEVNKINEEKNVEIINDSDNAEKSNVVNYDKEIKPILRKAHSIDMEKLPNLAEKKKAIDYCIKMKEKHDLPMKFIDAHFSFDGSRLTFAFIADGRVDFRELVKDLTRHFGRTIRLQQIGIRDEAKIMGDFGHCGRELCCKGHLKELSSITSEMAELQQCSHRGSERISGVCGRLMCCLAYEQDGYEKLDKELPAVGTTVRVEGKKGQVVGHNPLKKTINVKLPAENGDDFDIIEISADKIR